MSLRLPATRRNLLPKDFNGIVGVNIGLECDVPAILPVAHYLCAITKPIDLLDGIPSEGTGSHVKLSLTAHRSVARFQEAWFLEIAVESLKCPSANDCKKDACQVPFTRKLSNQDVLMQNVAVLAQKCFFLSAEIRGSGPVCADCTDFLAEREAKRRRAAWSRLPSSCNLGSWEQLETER